MKKYIFLSIIPLSFLFSLFLAQPCQAGEYYVTPDGSGSKTGANWANAWSPSDIAWASLDSAENTIYFDGGPSGVSYGHIGIGHDSDNSLYIRPGSYSPHPSGHSGPVTITTASDGANTCISTAHGYEIARNVTLSGETSAGAGTRNITIGPCGGEGIYNANYRMNGNKYLYLEIKETGTCYYGSNPPTCAPNIGSQMHAITADGNNDDIEVGYCYIHDTWVKGIKLNGATSGYGDIKIHHNTIRATSDDAIVCASGCDIDNNIVDGSNAPSYSGHPDALQADSRYIENIRIRNNEFRHYTQLLFFEADCMYQPDCSIRNILIANNVFEDRLKSPNLTFPGITLKTKGNGTNPGTWDNIIIANNTFVDLQMAPIGMGHTNSTTGLTTITNSKIVNNVMTGTSTNVSVFDNTGGAQMSPYSVTDTGMVFDYNLMYNGTAFDFWYNNGASFRFNYSPYTSFSDPNWLTDHPTFTHGSNAAPLFVNPLAYNYHLATSNPGLNLSSYFTADKDGVTRSEFTKGAYEYVQGGDTTAPAAPTGLVVR